MSRRSRDPSPLIFGPAGHSRGSTNDSGMKSYAFAWSTWPSRCRPLMELPFALWRRAVIIGALVLVAAQDSPPALVTLREIQGSGDDASPYEGQTVRV